MKVGDLLREAADQLPAGPGLPDPAREARWLLAAALGCPEPWLLAHADDTLPGPSVERFSGWLARRRAGERLTTSSAPVRSGGATSSSRRRC